MKLDLFNIINTGLTTITLVTLFLSCQIIDEKPIFSGTKSDKPPIITIINPTNNQDLNGDLSVIGTYLDDSGISNITLYLSNDIYNSNINMMPVNEKLGSYSIFTSLLPSASNYQIWVVAIDKSGNLTESPKFQCCQIKFFCFITLFICQFQFSIFNFIKFSICQYQFTSVIFIMLFICQSQFTNFIFIKLFIYQYLFTIFNFISFCFFSDFNKFCNPLL